jgi:hypothetical protein
MLLTNIYNSDPYSAIHIPQSLTKNFSVVKLQQQGQHSKKDPNQQNVNKAISIPQQF